MELLAAFCLKPRAALPQTSFSSWPRICCSRRNIYSLPSAPISSSRSAASGPQSTSHGCISLFPRTTSLPLLAVQLPVLLLAACSIPDSRRAIPLATRIWQVLDRRIRPFRPSLHLQAATPHPILLPIPATTILLFVPRVHLPCPP